MDAQCPVLRVVPPAQRRMAALLRRPGTAERNDEIEPLADRLIRQIGKRLARGQRVTRGDGEANDLAPPPHRWQYRRRRRPGRRRLDHHRSEEHTSELQSLMRTSYAVI